MKNAVFDGIGERTMFRQKNDKKRDQLNVQPVSCKDIKDDFVLAHFEQLDEPCHHKHLLDVFVDMLDNHFPSLC